MSTGESRTQISEQVLAEACSWFIECNQGELDAAGRGRFNEWLRCSREHVGAYLEIAAVWEESARLKGAQPSDPVALVTEALAETNVVPFGGREFSSGSEPHAPRGAGGGRVPWLLFAVAASALLAVGIGFLKQRNAYITEIGELRSIVLDDGSTVELDARSRVRVRFSQAERTVDLIDGQALFRVKKAGSRPFIVLSSGTRVLAVGTQFDVYRKATGTTVTVLEGRVAVTGASAPTEAREAEAPIFLSPGEQLTVSPRAAPHAVRADIAAVTAWTQGKLVFDETPLLEAVAEFNRYNSRQMIIEDASLAAYHVRGQFDAHDPNPLIQFLRARFDAEVREHGNEIHISRK
jgi:transmembrane sensor